MSRRIRWAADPLGGLSRLHAAAPPDAGQVLDIVLRVRTANAVVRAGKADEQNFADIAGGIGICRVLCEMAKFDDAIVVIDSANAALERAKDRRDKGMPWGLDGPGIAEVAEALDLYDQILSSGVVKRKHVIDAIDEMRRRVDNLTRHIAAS